MPCDSNTFGNKLENKLFRLHIDIIFQEDCMSRNRRVKYL